MDEFDPLDITPTGANGVNLIDPYELFSTPPCELVLSSTPSKPTRGAATRHQTKANDSFANTSSSSLHQLTTTTAANTTKNTTTTKNTGKSTRALKHRNINKSKSVDQSTTSGASRRRPITKKQKSENLWDKCLKKNPDLAQFVDEFNKSLTEACSKPLDTDDK